MKKNVSNNSNNSQQEKIIQQAFRIGGFVFPETIEEVKEFERIYGTTNIILPAELENPIFLQSKETKKSEAKLIPLQSQHLAVASMAARDGVKELSEEIKKQMAEDRKKANENRKNK